MRACMAHYGLQTRPPTNHPTNQPTKHRLTLMILKPLQPQQKCKIKEPSSWQIPKSSTVACFRRGMLGAGASRVSFNSWEMRRLRFPLEDNAYLRGNPILAQFLGFVLRRFVGHCIFWGFMGRAFSLICEICIRNGFVFVTSSTQTLHRLKIQKKQRNADHI